MDDKVCKWVVDDDLDTPLYETQCGNIHVFITEGPKENKHKFCPYCGNKLIWDEDQS